MRILELSQLAEKLDQFFHLVIWEKKDGFEVVAIVAEEFQDAFPLPMEVQAAAAANGMFLDTTTAAKLQIENMPADFWEDLDEVIYGEFLKVSRLGQSGRKYLEIFRAVNSGQNFDRSSLNDLGLSEADLLRVARWWKCHKSCCARVGKHQSVSWLCGATIIPQSLSTCWPAESCASILEAASIAGCRLNSCLMTSLPHIQRPHFLALLLAHRPTLLASTVAPYS